MSDEYVITTQGLTRYFGNKPAVYEVNLKVPRGCVFALLGRNGSGKTTLIRMLMGLLDPTRGQSTVFGRDSQNLTPDIRKLIGYMPESHPVYLSMTASNAGKFQSRFFPNWNKQIFSQVLENFHIQENTLAKNLSRGERAGLCMALMLAGGPELLVLDDPAMGLDPVARRSLMEILIQATRKQNRTIFFTSHLVDDIERMADHVAMLDYSVLKASAPMEEFRKRIRRVSLRFTGEMPQTFDFPGLLQAKINCSEIKLTFVDQPGASDDRIAKFGAAEVQEAPLSLEDSVIAYMDLHGKITRLNALIEADNA